MSTESTLALRHLRANMTTTPCYDARNITGEMKSSCGRKCANNGIDDKCNAKRLPTSDGKRNQKSTELPTLATFLHSKNCVDKFRSFLKQEYSEENLDFWLTVERYKKIDESKRGEAAARIYKTFIAVGSSQEVNINARTRDEISADVISGGYSHCPAPSAFDHAQLAIYKLMELDSYPRFLARHPTESPDLARRSPLQQAQELRTRALRTLRKTQRDIVIPILGKRLVAKTCS